MLSEHQRAFAACALRRNALSNLVKQYHAFKDKGFTILGVSLDNSRDAWLKAIEDDKLTTYRNPA